MSCRRIYRRAIRTQAHGAMCDEVWPAAAPPHLPVVVEDSWYQTDFYLCLRLHTKMSLKLKKLSSIKMILLLTYIEYFQIHFFYEDFSSICIGQDEKTSRIQHSLLLLGHPTHFPCFLIFQPHLLLSSLLHTPKTPLSHFKAPYKNKTFDFGSTKYFWIHHWII